MSLTKFYFLISCNSFSHLLLFIKKFPAVNYENEVYSWEGEIYDALQ